ncbi:MAG: GAF domain-containing protein [Leptolyngbyaceae cyanobacterium bins.349]|nr:GAF domain-containing protein [Leptolyngbyaceae cyanobacterium bins.349]
MLHLDDVIDHQFLTIAADATVEMAIALLPQAPQGCLMVVATDESARLVGVFAHQDVVRLLATQPDLARITVQAGMRSQPTLSCTQLANIPAILTLFQQYQLSALPIIDQQGIPLGWLTSQNLLIAFQAQQIQDAARFRPLFEQAAVGVAQVGLDGRWLLVNQALCKMLGYLAEELLSLTEASVIYRGDLPATQMYHQSLLRGDAETYSLEERFIRKDRVILWVSTSTSLVRNSANQPEYFIKIVRDISEHKLAETALKRQLNRALLLQKVTDAIRSQLDPQQIFEATVTQVGQAFNVNRCLLMTYKHSPQPQFFVAAEYVEPGDDPLALRTLFFKRNAYAAKVLSQDAAIASANVYADRLLQPMASLCQQFGLKSMLTVRTSYQGEPNGALVLHQCDQFRHWTSSEIQLLEAIAAQVGIALAQVRLLDQEKAQRQAIDQQNARLKQEIQKRKQVEVALSRSNAALRAQQEAALDGILVVNEHRQVLSFNHRFGEVWQIPNQQVQQADSPHLLQQVLSQVEHPQEFLHRVEYLYAHPDEISHEEIALKGGRFLERYSAPVQAETGEHYGRVWFFRDITERKQAEHQLEQRQRYLGVLVDIQRYFLAVSSMSPGYTNILQKLGQTCRADRVYLFENHRSSTNTLLMSQRAEWCAAGIEPEISNPVLQNLSYDDFFPRWAATLASGESINGIVANFPAGERAVLEPQGIQAILILPLMVNKIFWGFIGFDNCTEARPWTTSEISLLSVAASSISLYQERQQAEAALRQSINRERATLRVIERMRQTLDLEQIFDATVNEVRQLLGCDRGIIYQFQPDWSGAIVAESCVPPWQPLMPSKADLFPLSSTLCNSDRCQIKSWGTPASDSTPTHSGCTATEHRYTSVSNIDTANLSLPYLNILQQWQAKAYLIVPIYRGSALWGLLASYQNSDARHWEMSEINLVMHISTQLGIALQQAELFNQTQKQSKDLEKARDAAEAANHAKSEFLTNISHELRTPLNAILGFTQVMSHDVTNTKHREYINIINRSGQHLLKLINDVLEMSKIEAGRHRLNPSSFDLYHLLDSLYEMLSLKAQAKQLTLTFDIAPEIPQYLTTDEGKLRQVLLNLLGNAIKFTPAGAVSLRVCSTTDRAATVYDATPLLTPQSALADSSQIILHFEVEDSGIGIAPEEIADLFTPFVQTYAGQQSSEGTGLGLAISQKFVQLLGGAIAVDSLPNRGSCFRFDIVVTPAPPLTIEITPSYQQVISLEPEQPTQRILIVEDCWENQQLLIELLRPVGFQVQLAAHGQEAIQIWETWHPHLILMDIRMPIMDGYEATRQIRALEQASFVTGHPSLAEAPISNDQGQRTKIIALTASAFEEDRARVLAIGCNDFISKPFQEEVIFAKLAEHLQVRYVYENSKFSKQTATTAQNHEVLQNSLKTMPESWIMQLTEAAIQGRDGTILELTEQIPETNSALREKLETLTHSFQFEEIIHLISS